MSQPLLMPLLAAVGAACLGGIVAILASGGKARLDARLQELHLERLLAQVVAVQVHARGVHPRGHKA